MPEKITSPEDQSLDELCRRLAEGAADIDTSGDWPGEQLRLCGEYGVYEWFLAEEHGGQGFSGVDIIRGYLKLSAACLTTTFVITQYTGACRRIAGSDNDFAKTELLPDLLTGRAFATVGISHLTTSRRHLKKPVLRAEERDDGFLLDGYSPWVTGAAHAQHVVIGATLDDGREILIAAPTDLPGVETPPHAQLVGLTASHTGPIKFENTLVDRQWLLAGPVENVMTTGQGAATGGLQTSTLAIGLARAAIDFLKSEVEKRDDLQTPHDALDREQQQIESDLLALAVGDEACSMESLRQRANSIALRCAQGALAAAKGAGYVAGHPAGRWCREALFFLVWSCPQPVMQANLCELAGLAE